MQGEAYEASENAENDCDAQIGAGFNALTDEEQQTLSGYLERVITALADKIGVDGDERDLADMFKERFFNQHGGHGGVGAEGGLGVFGCFVGRVGRGGHGCFGGHGGDEFCGGDCDDERLGLVMAMRERALAEYGGRFGGFGRFGGLGGHHGHGRFDRPCGRAD